MRVGNEIAPVGPMRSVARVFETPGFRDEEVLKEINLAGHMLTYASRS